MSRSYQHNPIIKDRDKNGTAQKHANRKVRRTLEIGNHAYYKRVYEQWDISDYKFGPVDISNMT